MTEEQENLFEDNFDENDKIGNVDFWDYKSEGQIVGLFRRFDKDNYGEHSVLQTEDKTTGEKTEKHLPNLTALNGKLKAGDVNENSKIKIVYKGQQKAKSGRFYEDFDVFIKNLE